MIWEIWVDEGLDCDHEVRVKGLASSWDAREVGASEERMDMVGEDGERLALESPCILPCLEVCIRGWPP